MNAIAPAEDADWTTSPSYSDVSSICASRVPIDQCAWVEHSYRVFHVGPIDDYVFTGKIEITLKNVNTDETWECFDGKYTEEADASEGAIQYTDKPVDADSFVSDFGYYWIVWDEDRTLEHFTAPFYDYVGYNFVYEGIESGT